MGAGEFLFGARGDPGIAAVFPTSGVEGETAPFERPRMSIDVGGGRAGFAL